MKGEYENTHASYLRIAAHHLELAARVCDANMPEHPIVRARIEEATEGAKMVHRWLEYSRLIEEYRHKVEV